MNTKKKCNQLSLFYNQLDIFSKIHLIKHIIYKKNFFLLSKETTAVYNIFYHKISMYNNLTIVIIIARKCT